MQIVNQSQYYGVVAKIETFVEKGFNNLNEKETDELKELSIAVEQYEEKMYPMPLQTTLPDLLTYYMYTEKINQTELSKRLKMPSSTISGLITGKKKLNMDIAKRLHEELKIDGNLLLESA